MADIIFTLVNELPIFKAGSQELHRLVSLGPDIKGSLIIISTSQDHLFVLQGPINAIIQGLLRDTIKVSNIGNLDHQPPLRWAIERFTISQHERSLDMVCPVVVVVADRVHTTTEVKRPSEPKLIDASEALHRAQIFV